MKAGFFDETIKVKQEDKMPYAGSCIVYGRNRADILTLCKLMISISDNTATNLLIKRFGIEALSQEFKKDRPQRYKTQPASV